MITQQQEILDTQKNIWNKYSGGWKKWDDFIMTAMHPVNDRILDILALKGDEYILDVASGTGEPGLTISSFLTDGMVVGTDLSEKMVAIANEHSRKRGIKNYKSEECNAAQLPFEDESFDHVTCRFGLLYFPDVTAAISEMNRVLKPGGKLVITAWSTPDQNSCFTILGGPVMEKLNLPDPPPDAPGLFRFSAPGTIVQLMDGCGFKTVTESAVKGNMDFESPEQYWEMMMDVSGPIVEALQHVSDDVVEDIKSTVFSNARSFSQRDGVCAGWTAKVVAGTKV